MQLDVIRIRNCVVYKTSKSTEPIKVSGKFTKGAKQYNGRIKLMDDAGNVYWMESLDSYTVTDDIKITPLEQTTKSVAVEESVETVVKEVKPVYHVVKRGETVQSIAQQYNLPITSLTAQYRSLAVGQRIRIK